MLIIHHEAHFSVLNKKGRDNCSIFRTFPLADQKSKLFACRFARKKNMSSCKIKRVYPLVSMKELERVLFFLVWGCAAQLIDCSISVITVYRNSKILIITHLKWRGSHHKYFFWKNIFSCYIWHFKNMWILCTRLYQIYTEAQHMHVKKEPLPPRWPIICFDVTTHVQSLSAEWQYSSSPVCVCMPVIGAAAKQLSQKCSWHFQDQNNKE